MAGRGQNLENKLPLFMMNQVDRNSFNYFNEKNLKMNYYSNGQLKQLISCLNEKKSFNFKLKEEKEEETEEKKNFEHFAKQIFEKGIINNNEFKSFDEDSVFMEKKFIIRFLLELILYLKILWLNIIGKIHPLKKLMELLLKISNLRIK